MKKRTSKPIFAIIISCSLLFISCKKHNASQSVSYRSALNLSRVTNIHSKIWARGSNSIIVGLGLNTTTIPCIGWAQQYGGVYCTFYSILGVGQSTEVFNNLCCV